MMVLLLLVSSAGITVANDSLVLLIVLLVPSVLSMLLMLGLGSVVVLTDLQVLTVL